MGTNYYWIKDKCACCGRGEKFHIGKKSGGWEFNFQSLENYGGDKARSWQEWKALLAAEPNIVDEYGKVISLEEFVEMVSCRIRQDGTPLQNQYDYCEQNGYLSRFNDYRKDWKDAEGYAFTSGDYS